MKIRLAPGESLPAKPQRLATAGTSKGAVRRKAENKIVPDTNSQRTRTPTEVARGTRTRTPVGKRVEGETPASPSGHIREDRTPRAKNLRMRTPGSPARLAGMGLGHRWAHVSGLPASRLLKSPKNPKIPKAGDITFDYVIPLANAGYIDFHHRVKNLEKILKAVPPHVHVVLVEQVLNGKRATFERNLKFPSHLNYTYVKVRRPVFNKCWLYNLGARKAQTDRLIFGEADMYVEPNYFVHLWNVVTSKKDLRWCFGWCRILYHNVTGTGYERVVKPARGGAEGGLVYYQKQFFWQIGGYNEWMEDLGGPDNEIIRRAERASSKFYFDWTVDHLWHAKSRLKKSRRRNRNKYLVWTARDHPVKMIQTLSGYVEQAGRPAKPLSSRPLPGWWMPCMAAYAAGARHTTVR